MKNCENNKTRTNLRPKGRSIYRASFGTTKSKILWPRNAVSFLWIENFGLKAKVLNPKIFNKKSQAAIEFLITYGWAILGVMVVVGALAYFGVFNTDRFINDECSFGTQLYCEDFILTSGGQLRISLRNNFGQQISINGARIYYEGVLRGGLTPIIVIL